ncbi:S-layer homology domain-containing protein [Anaerotalea alkaliphila]|uniref:S-layer homology domain-containing protein n=1 Tax=Anaerotalea alkaliphila TaxID=2662126 RepID=A0A7X5HV74_9FIRM|nr:S-layer homology domain-containing protein [Anaerotalea alkaliphila]NDL67253.1 S-layer homology domain-containing protein [Anaerotalea alkaliphila]
MDIKKKLLACICTASLLLTLGNGTLSAASAFPDTAGHWAETEIAYLAGEGLVNGFPDGTFGPERTLTRAQVAMVVAAQLQLAQQPAGFPDVPAGHWASQAIGALEAAGVMNGYPDGTFLPEKAMTRAEVAAVLAGAYSWPSTGTSSPFSDVPASHWAFGHVQAMRDNFITTGYPDGTYKPGNPMTRAEFSIFMAKAVNPAFTQPAMLTALAQDISALLDDGDMDGLAAYAHPDKGIRFSPYTWVENDHQVVSPAALSALLTGPAILVWGVEDGTGDDIEMTAQAYFDRYVAARDFSVPNDIQYDTVVSRGSLLNNIPDFYPDAVFVELFVEGTTQYGGMDWRSRYIVLEEQDGVWYVVAVVNGEWTT